MSAVVGPKISSWAIRMPRLDVGEDRRPVVEALGEVAVGRALAAGEELAPSSSPILEYVSILSIAAALITGPRSVSASQPGPIRIDSARCDEPLGELVVDGLVDDHAARGGAALAGRAERRPDDALDGEVEVGVVHHDDPVLAAELEVDVLELVGRVLRHQHAGLAGAGERDHRDVRMPDEPVARLLAEAVDEIDDARGEAGLLEQLDEALGEQRRVLGGLEARPCCRRRARARASTPGSRSGSSRA